MIKNILLLLLTLSIAACGGSSGGGEEELTENPIARSVQLFGQEGNLWKPSADNKSSGAGNLVVLFSSKYTTTFDSCEVPLNDGTTAQLVCIDDQPWTQVPYSCLSNGGRQTWRANFGCSRAGAVQVICRDAMQEITFTVPDELKGLVCNRFG